MNEYNRIEYTAQPIEKKEELLRALPQVYPGFTFAGMKRFEAFGQATDTAIFRYEDGCEFVFVPGDTVTLGWDGSASEMDEETRQDIAETLREYDVLDVDQFLKDSCTPVRTATLPPMLVEREVREIGWFDVPVNSSAIQENEELRAYVQQYLTEENPGVHEWHNTLKLQYADDVLQAQLYQGIGYHEFLERVRSSAFDVPTADEWEYLCGGGSRTLWRWGDSFDYGMEVPHFRVEGSAAHWNIEWPNQFGLVIGFDPYRYEVVAGGDIILKAGDGGCNICGGMGLALGFLPVATYFKGYDATDDELDYLDDIGGDYTSYRRLIRLG